MNRASMSIQGSRPNELERIKNWFGSSAEEGSVKIYGLSGFGGIGKSYLLNHALEQIAPRSKGYLQIVIDGSDRLILGNLMAIYEKQLRPATIRGGKRNFDYFPESGKLAKKHVQLAKSVGNELKSTNVSDGIKKAAQLIFRGGSLLNKSIPISKNVFDIEALAQAGLDKHLETAIDVLSDLESLDTSWIPSAIKGPLGLGYADRVKGDLFRLASEEWIADLSAIFGKPRGFKLTQSPIKEYGRLLLVVDDFEILGKTVTEFLVNSLIPLLQSAPFSTTLVVVGRDDLYDAHISFQHHLSHLVVDKLRLDRFSPEVTREMFLGAGYSDGDLPDLLEESQGFPFLVTLLCEAKGGTVSFYKQFYERTTRWMTDTQRNWVLPLCYLDRIDEQTVEQMLGMPSGKPVMEWFSHEASLRDPNAEWFVIAPYIRRTLKEYHVRMIGEKKHGEFEQRGRGAMESVVGAFFEKDNGNIKSKRGLAEKKKKTTLTSRTSNQRKGSNARTPK